MPEFPARLRRELRYLLRDARGVGLLPSVGLRLRSALGRTNPVPLEVGGVPLLVRPGTADLKLAISSLVEGEYDGLPLAEPEWILDAGANIGTSAIAFARRYPGARVLALEPEAENYALLERNVRAWPQVIPVRAALGPEGGEVELFDRGTGPWGYTVIGPAGEVRDTGQRVRAVTVTELMREHGIARIDLLKLDIEGGERDVLDACEGWIDRVDVLVVELHERIVEGCEAAFRRATGGFASVTAHRDKHIAVRKLHGSAGDDAG